MIKTASINKVLTVVRKGKPRSAWGVGVKKYAIVTNVPMRTYKVHVFKNGSETGKTVEMKASTIPNLRKNIIAKFRSRRSMVNIIIDSSTGQHVGSIMMHPMSDDVLWFGNGKIDKASLIVPSTGALKSVSKSRRA